MWKRLAAVAALPLLLAACGGASSSTGATHVMSDGSTMSGSSMAGMPGMTSSPGLTAQHGGQGGGTPSESASMICGSEIRDAVRHNLDLSRTPVGLHAWQHRTFSCTYQLAGGDLRLSVKDLDTAGPGRGVLRPPAVPAAGAAADPRPRGLRSPRRRDRARRRRVPQGRQDPLGRRQQAEGLGPAHGPLPRGRRVRRRRSRHRLLERVKS